MQAVEQLWQAYQEWKRFTEQEGIALQRADWPAVQKAQKRKRELQSEIVRLTDYIKANLSSSIEQEHFNARLRGIVNELILLETRNNANVGASIQAAQEEKRTLDATSNRLRQVHNRYVGSRAAVWQNLS